MKKDKLETIRTTNKKLIDQPNSSHILSDDEKQAIHCASFDLQENHENYTTWSVSLIGFS